MATDPFADESTTTTTKPPVTPPGSGDRSRYAEYAFFTNAMATQGNEPTLQWVISQFGHYPSYEEWVAYDSANPSVWKQIQSNPSYTDQSTGSVYRWNPDPYGGQGNYIRVGDNPTAAATAKSPTTYPLPSGQNPTFTDANGNVNTWNPYKGTYDVSGYTAPAGTSGGLTPAQIAANAQWEKEFGYSQSQDTASRAFQEKQFAYQQQQDAEQAQIAKDKNLAQLRANPSSWLEYSLMANQTPVVQPWMLPLSPQEYGLKAGMEIPGWQGLPKPMDATKAIPVSPTTPTTPVPGTAPVGTTPTGVLPTAAPPQLSATSNPVEQRAAIDQVIGMGNFPDPTVRENLATTWQGNYQNAIQNPVVAAPPQQQMQTPPASVYQPPPLDPTQIYLPPGYEQYAGYANGTGGPLPYDQTAIVGENGPELANLQAGSQITPLNQSTYPALTPGVLPWLMTPSTQYQARLGPAALGQYYGYEQMRTGAPPDDQAWRLGQMAPPSGANRGFTYR